MAKRSKVNLPQARDRSAGPKELFPQKFGPQGIAKRRFDGASRRKVEALTELYFDKHSVQVAVFFGQHAEVACQPDEGETIHCLGTLDKVACFQNADCTAHFIRQPHAVVLKCSFLSRSFLTNDVLQRVIEAIDNGGFKDSPKHVC